MFELVETSGYGDRLRLYNLGLVINAATGNPDELKKLLRDPTQVVTATGMLKIPKKKKNTSA